MDTVEAFDRRRKVIHELGTCRQNPGGARPIGRLALRDAIEVDNEDLRVVSKHLIRPRSDIERVRSAPNAGDFHRCNHRITAPW